MEPALRRRQTTHSGHECSRSWTDRLEGPNPAIEKSNQEEGCPRVELLAGGLLDLFTTRADKGRPPCTSWSRHGHARLHPDQKAIPAAADPRETFAGSPTYRTPKQSTDRETQRAHGHSGAPSHPQHVPLLESLVPLQPAAR
jgi:hypothetical protein